MKSVLLLIALFFIVRALKRSLESRRRSAPAAGPSTGPGPAPNNAPVDSEEMVLDEVCGSYVPISSAITSTTGGAKAYFCSEECRRGSEGRP